ncbi:MAG: pilus assembly protein [Alphaproteobacteria bacterium]|nr:pilus assembly protein [Alphaproteobacteria bacterium]
MKHSRKKSDGKHYNLIRKLLRFQRNKKGIAAVEFAIIAPVFFFTLISIIETGLIQLSSRSMDIGVEKIGRLIRTGQINSISKAKFREELCKHVRTFISCDKLVFQVLSFDSFKKANEQKIPRLTGSGFASPQSASAYQTSGPKDIVLFRLMYKWESFTPQLKSGRFSRRYVLLSSNLFQNEPFP